MPIHHNYSGSDCTTQSLVIHRFKSIPNWRPSLESERRRRETEAQRAEAEKASTPAVKAACEGGAKAVSRRNANLVPKRGNMAYQADASIAVHLRTCENDCESLQVGTELYSVVPNEEKPCRLCRREARPKRIANNRSPSNGGLCRWAARAGMLPGRR